MSTDNAANDSERDEKLFETVFEHANDAIFVVDLENDSIVDANPAAEELSEYSRAELLSMPASDLHPHNLSEFMGFADTVVERGRGTTDDITCYCKSGDIIPAEMSASIVELDGRPHLVNHVRDTRDQEEREWFEDLIEHSNDLTTVVKRDGTIRYQSPAIEPILGYQPDEVRDESIFEFVHADDRTDVREALEETVASEDADNPELRYRFRRADGSWAWLESIASHRPDSHVLGIVINSRDVTARTQSQQQAAVLQRMLRHNLRNSLVVVKGHANDLLEADDETVASRAENILDSTETLESATSYTGILSDILDSPIPEQHRYEMPALLERLVEGFRERYPGAAVDVELPEEAVVIATPKLAAGLRHLLENAVEHNDADAPRVTVTVRSSADEGHVDVTVADNGPGIPAHERATLLEGEERPLRHGSGLGLWIVNWIVNRSGGRISFDDNDPRGSRVTLTLPAPRDH